MNSALPRDTCVGIEFFPPDKNLPVLIDKSHPAHYNQPKP